MWFVSAFRIFISFDRGECVVVQDIFSKMWFQVFVKPFAGCSKVLIHCNQEVRTLFVVGSILRHHLVLKR